jgi:hypothetical protein
VAAYPPYLREQQKVATREPEHNGLTEALQMMALGMVMLLVVLEAAAGHRMGQQMGVRILPVLGRTRLAHWRFVEDLPETSCEEDLEVGPSAEVEE